MQLLPQFQNDDKDLQLMQTKWSSVLNPVLRNPLLYGVQLTDIPLVSGNNIINTTLGRKYQGYLITGMRTGFAQVYEVTSNNPTLNLTLNSNATSTIDLYVF